MYRDKDSYNSEFGYNGCDCDIYNKGTTTG